jgi:hypothetical protein
MQQLNLYKYYLSKNPKPIDKNAVWSVTLGSSLIFIAWIGFSVAQYFNFGQLRDEQKRHLQTLKTQIAQLDAATTAGNVDSITKEIDDLVPQLAERYRSLQSLRVSAGDSQSVDRTVAKYFQALSKIHSRGIQVKIFRVEEDGQALYIEGAASSGALFSQYVQRIAADETMKSKEFNFFKVDKPEAGATTYRFIISTNELSGGLEDALDAIEAKNE